MNYLNKTGLEHLKTKIGKNVGQVKITSGTTITNGYQVTLPLKYKVRQSFFMGKYYN